MKSMTGFGESSFQSDQHKVRVEIKTLNNRYIDISIKIPKEFMALENTLQKRLKTYFSRGKIEAVVHIQSSKNNPQDFKLNSAKLEGYLKLLDQANQLIANKFSKLPMGELDLLRLLENPEFFEGDISTESENDEKLESSVLDTLDKACNLALKARVQEGYELSKVLQQYLSTIENKIGYFRNNLADLRNDIHDRYIERLKSIQNSMRENISIEFPEKDKILQEVLVFIEKADIEEEVSRLEAHCNQLKDFLQSKQPIGRKMDFLCQELGREANTILSKSSRADFKEQGIELKQTIEQIRQQVQNIE